MDDLRKQTLNKSLPPMPNIPVHATKRKGGSKRSFEPLNWKSYFDSSQDITVESGTVRVYRKGNSGPLLLMIHGGGFSALSFAVFSKMITEAVPCQCLAFDLRGHGDTHLSNEGDLSIENLSNDVRNVMRAIYPNGNSPSTVVIGHSLGGAIAVHAASDGAIENLKGLVVIDVVEGTALESLSSMSVVLAGRPRTFRTIDKAIQWCVTSGMIRNLESARVSFPGQLVRCDTHSSAVEELNAGRLHPGYVQDGNLAPTDKAAEAGHHQFASSATNMTAVAEEEEIEGSEFSQSTTSQRAMSPPSQKEGNRQPELTWRIDLNTTSPFWSGWFKGLSNRFLQVPAAKMVALAGTDRLDKDLTIGQMQGKFQMNFLQNCGHIIHEDVPDKLCDVIATFLTRNRISEDPGTVNKVFPCC